MPDGRQATRDAPAADPIALMASVTATGRRTRVLAIRTVTDRGQLRAFLETDRLLAAYAICAVAS